MSHSDAVSHICDCSSDEWTQNFDCSFISSLFSLVSTLVRRWQRSLESLAAGCALCALHDSARAKITMQSAAFKNLSGLIFDRDQPDQEELVAEVRSSR
mgnify:FL=1